MLIPLIVFFFSGCVWHHFFLVGLRCNSVGRGQFAKSAQSLETRMMVTSRSPSVCNVAEAKPVAATIMLQLILSVFPPYLTPLNSQMSQGDLCYPLMNSPFLNSHSPPHPPTPWGWSYMPATSSPTGLTCSLRLCCAYGVIIRVTTTCSLQKKLIKRPPDVFSWDLFSFMFWTTLDEQSFAVVQCGLIMLKHWRKLSWLRPNTPRCLLLRSNPKPALVLRFLRASEPTSCYYTAEVVWGGMMEPTTERVTVKFVLHSVQLFFLKWD